MAKSKIHELIHSLNMSEKRYFKIFSQKHIIGEGNNYVGLFDLIDKQKTPDDVVLKKSKYVKNLSAEKNYLYNLILKSLLSFHTNFSTKTKIFNLLRGCEILYSKGLYDQCNSLIKKARTMAEDNELISCLLVIKELEEDIAAKKLDYDRSLEIIVSTEEDIAKLENFYTIQYHTTIAYKKRLATGGARSEDHIKEIDELVKIPVVQDESKALTWRARLFQLSLKLTDAHARNDSENEIGINKEIIELYESSPILTELSPIGYITSLYNIANTHQALGEYDESDQFIEKLEAANDLPQVHNSPIAAARVFFLSNNLKLYIGLKHRAYKLCDELHEEIKKDIEKHEANAPKPMVYDMYFMLSKLFFIQGDVKLALRFTNEILNDLSFKVRNDLLSMIRLFNLIIHHQLGNSFTAEYLAQSTMQYFKRKNRLFKVERLVLRYIKNHDTYATREDKRKALSKLKEELLDLRKDPFEKKAFNFLDFIAWIDSQLLDKPLREIYGAE